jgi:hypothetical protein
MTRATEKAKKGYLGSISDEIIAFQKKRGRYDLMYKKEKELGWKDNQGIRTIDIEDSQRNIIIDQRHVLKIWQTYITELYDRTNRSEIREVGTADEVDEEEEGPNILQSEVDKSIKKRGGGGGKKATGDDVPRDVLQFLGEEFSI